jgi:hypothetical protein
MHTLKWIVIALGLLQGGWLVFDGTRALATGNYVTPTSGPRAGQLGPWSHIVTAIGLQPRSTIVKWAHVILGLAWLMALVLFILQPEKGRWAVLSCCVATLWYAPVGTVVSTAILVVLITTKLRAL